MFAEGTKRYTKIWHEIVKILIFERPVNQKILKGNLIGYYVTKD